MLELISEWIDVGVDGWIDHHVLKTLSIQINGVIPSLFSKHLQYFSAGNRSCKEVNGSLFSDSSRSISE